MAPGQLKEITGPDQEIVKRVERVEEKTSSSPIQFLIRDLLVEIFAQAMLQDPESFHNKNWDKVSPNNVAGVCRNWRRIALDSPMLWSRFHWEIFTDKYVTVNWTHLRRFVLRAGRIPLDIKLDGAVTTLAEYTKLLAFITSNQQSFRRLHVCIYWSSTGRGAVEWEPFVLSNTPLLEELNIVIDHVQLDLTRSRRLKDIRIHGIVGFHNLGGLILANLTNIDLKHRDDRVCEKVYTIDHYLMLLEAAPSLESFRATRLFNARIQDSTYWNESRQLELARLTTFSLFGSATPIIARLLLDRLSLPRLTNLKLFGQHRTNKTAEGVVGSFMSRPKPMLERFVFRALELREIMLCIESAPNLRHLDAFVVQKDESEELCLRLTLDEHTRLCPMLESIHFYRCDFEYKALSNGVVERMIVSRWKVPGEERCLKAVPLELCNVAPKALSSDIRECMREGLQLPIKNEDEEELKLRNLDFDESESEDSVSSVNATSDTAWTWD